ncbi:hypothetical protein DF054_22790 [Burkholderia cepacia]|nr:hypothetical protein DF055_19990 [Burkholderia cepacia]RRA04928.1 hypothetical protein DF054_22790 [Burkholderia cepacia]
MVAAAIVSAVVGAAHAAAPEFKQGEVLTAQKLNQSFASAYQRADELAEQVFWLKIAVAALAAVTVVSLVRRRGAR